MKINSFNSANSTNFGFRLKRKVSIFALANPDSAFMKKMHRKMQRRNEMSNFCKNISEKTTKFFENLFSSIKK